MNRFNLTIIRHAESVVNQDPDRIGQAPDTSLSSKGFDQADKLASKLAKKHFDYIFSSNYTRALETANIATRHILYPYISSSEKIEVVEALREYSAGDWVGKSRSEIIKDGVKIQISNLNNTFLFPNGESLTQVERRASSWLEERILYNKTIIEESKKRELHNANPIEILIFSHGMTIKCLLH